LYPPHECKQHSHCAQFLNKEDGSKINLLVKSLHYELFPNGQYLVFFKIDFPIFYKLKCEIIMTIPISMRFCTFLFFLLREIFYTFPSYDTFFLKVYTLNILIRFFKNCFFILYKTLRFLIDHSCN